MSNFPNTKYKNISLIYLYSLDNELYKSLVAKDKIASDAVDFFNAKSKDVKQIRSSSEVLRNMGYGLLIDKYLKEQEAIQQKKLENQRRAEEERLRKKEKKQRRKEKAKQKKLEQELKKLGLLEKEKAARLKKKQEFQDFLAKKQKEEEEQLKKSLAPQPVTDRYCLDDDTKMNLSSTVTLRTKKEMPVYECPKCKKRFMFTSGESFIREDYTPCYVFGKNTPQQCCACGTKLIITDERIFGYWGRTGLEYCERCRIFHVPFEMYRVSEQEWRPRNSDELKTLESKFGFRSKTIQIISTPRHRTVQDTSRSVGQLETTPIAFKDFIVRRSVFKCKNAGHRLQNITGIVKIMNRKGEIEDAHIPAGYCPDCNRYFIMENTYQACDPFLIFPAVKSVEVLICNNS